MGKVAKVRRYQQVPHDIEDDPRFTGLTLTDWGVYLRLRNLADTTYPDPAPIPRWATDDVLGSLVERELVTPLPGDRYRLPELDAERGEESTRNAAASAARWGRDAGGIHVDAAGVQPVPNTNPPGPASGTKAIPTGLDGTERNGTTARAMTPWDQRAAELQARYGGGPKAIGDIANAAIKDVLDAEVQT